MLQNGCSITLQNQRYGISKIREHCHLEEVLLTPDNALMYIQLTVINACFIKFGIFSGTVCWSHIAQTVVNYVHNSCQLASIFNITSKYLEQRQQCKILPLL